MPEQNNAINSLAHTKWNCKYHIVFAPKYRRKVFFAEKREAIREILRTLCQWKGVEIIEGGMPMSRWGNPHDNAMTKFLLYPENSVHLLPQTCRYIHFYNQERIPLKTGEAPLARRLSA